MLTQIALATLISLLMPDTSASVFFKEPTASVDTENGAKDGVSDTIFLSATDDGSQGNRLPTSGGANPSSGDGLSRTTDPMSGLGQIQDDQWCGWSPLPTPLPSSDALWGGNAPDSGTLMFRSCSVLFPGAPDAPGNLAGRPVDIQFFPNATPIVPPPPDPAALAQQAIGRLQVPRPAIGAGPDRTKLAVNLWTWLWIDNPGPLSATVAAGGVSVTATVNLASVTWNVGEPITTGDTYAPGTAATLTCQGTGTPPPAGYDWKAEPPCGHMFRWRSLKERTGGTGKWPITATSTWNVTWQSNTGVTGATTLAATAADQFDVGEFRTVLVQGPGG